MFVYLPNTSYFLHFQSVRQKKWNIHNKTDKYLWHFRSKPHQTTSLIPQRCIFLQQYIRLAPLPSYRAVSCHYLSIFIKRAKMTVTWSHFVNNTLIAYTFPRRNQGIVYKIGPGNRHFGAFAEKCINNRTIQRDTKEAEPIVYCFRKMHLWGTKPHAVYSIPQCFYHGWSAYLGTISKISVWSNFNGYITGAAAS